MSAESTDARASLAKLDIVERLRESQAWERVGSRHEMLREAADEIERLRAENAKLTERLWRCMNGDLNA